MKSPVKSLQKLNEADDEEFPEESEIRWSDLIFLPFHPVFKMFVLISVIVKSVMAPIQSVYSIVHCSDVMDRNNYLFFIKYIYCYICDPIYAVDTFLHIVHRQVTDKAMKREHLPKSAFCLLLDVLSLIPFFTMVTTEECPAIQLWPNILAFSEFLVIYRIVGYFSLVTTHSYRQLFLGFSILFFISINCVGCFLLLLTTHGLCENCEEVYDWRKYVIHKLNETDERFTIYFYATTFMYSLAITTQIDDIKPSTVLEYAIITSFIITAYIFQIYILLPKLFAESILSLRRICTFYPHVRRIVEETKRRNPSATAHINVSKFYDLMWKKRSGVTKVPEIIYELPRYLRVDISQDLVWPVFYHSPTLRKTSTPFKRWLSDSICMDYKLPGEKFFVGPHCHTNLYYLKSGIVQLISADDGVTPLLSLTGGTIFGDVSFLVPPLKRTLIVRSVSYCEVFIVSRFDILKAMQKYPSDRKNIVASVKERLKHARTLYTCKQHVRGLDRVEDEGLAWLKRRWWEISEAVANWKKRPKNSLSTKCELPPEEAVYHCAKYIGQLVLCTDLQLHRTSLFANVKFPWILTPNSVLIWVWKRVVMFTVFVALILYPPLLTSKHIVNWFIFIRIWTDFVYIIDVCISMMTSPVKNSVSDSFAAVMFEHCKTSKFVLDVLSTAWIEVISLLAGKPEYYYVCQFNRLIKVYVLFSSEYVNEWTISRAPFINVCYKVTLQNFCYLYVVGYVMYFLVNHVPNLTAAYYFGELICTNDTSFSCDIDTQIVGVAIRHIYEIIFFEVSPRSINDICFFAVIAYVGFLIYVMTKCKLIAYLYLKYRQIINYQVFVSNLKKYYQHHKIHNDLLKRLDRYLMCQWKYYQGADIMNPNLLKQEPFDIYWKVHGEVAEKIIGESKAFAGADPVMVRELAYAAKFFVMPKNATLFLFGVQCRNVTWIVKGHIKCEYHNESGELLKSYYNPGEMVSVSAVLLRKPSIRTYMTSTECELIYISIQDFYSIIRRYPHEWSYFQNCIEELEPVFEDMFETYVKKHRDYQKKLRERIFHSRHTGITRSENEDKPKSIDLLTRVNPDSDFMYYWMMFRTLTVMMSIISAAAQGGSGAVYRWPLMIIGTACDCIAWIDIALKMFMTYYNEKGILIFDTRMRLCHYLTRGFLLDVVGAMPWTVVFNMIAEQEIAEHQALLLNTFSKFGHLYILMACFNHVADKPSVNSVYILIIKWQVVIVLVMMGGSHFLMNHCLEITFDSNKKLVDMTLKDGCWIPGYMVVDKKPTVPQLHLLFAQSFNLAQSALMRMNLGKFHIDRTNPGVGFILVIMALISWFVMCYSLTLLILSSRYNTVFQHGVNQLQKFLHAERVDKHLINEAVAHYGYWWLRNKGINRHRLMNERIGVVFRQDLSYYFFKKTFVSLDTLLHGGEQLQRQLSSIASQLYFRPGQEIIREMDLIPSVHVVHRGKVIISKEGVKVAELTKGGIFGQLDGTRPRPVRVSVRAEGFVDILQMTIEQFQETITDEVRQNIARGRKSQDDYMATKKHISENPYNTVEYILRGRKSIRLPGMTEPVEANKNTWYSKWLFVSWVAAPAISAVVVLLLTYLPQDSTPVLLYALLIFDVTHLAHFVSEFYTLELTVVNGVLVKRRLGYRLLKYWGFYLDAISLILPHCTFVTGDWGYQLARLLRLRLLYEFYRHFCISFKSRVTPIFMKFMIVLLFMHAMTCGWIYVACRNEGPFPVPILDMPHSHNETLDRDEWVDPRHRVAGCPRMTMAFKGNSSQDSQVSFVVPVDWYNDYIVAMLYTVLLLTHSTLDTVAALTIKEVYFKIMMNWMILLLDLWLVSVAVSAVYTNFRELFQYDHSVYNLTTYLHHNGLSPALLHSVREYTRQLWQRQRGNWLPELAHQAPLCLQEDMLSALYMHHLKAPVLFRNLPEYFIRQVVARFRRVVIFPGKCVVQEGDIFSCMYFIHEGEVEKWYTDASGENKMMSLLSTNGYFGLVPGLFPNVPFAFSYYTRTVVDLVYLRLNAWQDLLTAYPDIRHELYECAKQLKKDLKK